MYWRKKGLCLARSLITFAMGLLSCLNANTPSFAAGNAPTTIFVQKHTTIVLRNYSYKINFMVFSLTLTLTLRNQCVCCVLLFSEKLLDLSWKMTWITPKLKCMPILNKMIARKWYNPSHSIGIFQENCGWEAP